MLKSQTVIFRPYQRKLNYSVNIEIIDNCTQFPTTLQCEDHVKYLGVLLDSNLSWKFQINNVALKISRTVGVVARLRHFVPRTTLLNIYQSSILLIWHMVWRLGVKLPKPIYKKFSCFKNESFVWFIFLNPEPMLCLYLFPQKFYPYKCYMLKNYLL